MVAEEIVVSLSGGAPWGFRLQGGADQQKPLQVAKVRRRSKACRAGLREYDELIAIGHHVCAELSHAEAMSLIDTQSGTLNLRVKRAPGGLHSSSYSGCSASPRTSTLSPTVIPSGITSPPDSEAYYGETDSDADTQSLTHRRQRRTPPHARSPARYDNQEEEETSEMSGYESATDVGLSLQGQWEAVTPVGVPRRELLYQPLQTKWATPSHTPYTLTPHTLTPPPDQGLAEAEGEGDSGFQEAGGCVGLACPPLVSPERAREALMLGTGKQLVPMVGPQQMPVSDELSATYMDKARQASSDVGGPKVPHIVYAELQRGESLVEKQVKEARTKCRSIASLLTDAPNPNSKGVLMFKKRRQRAKKYTLTCFGKAEGDRGGETEGETGGETEEEGGSSILSGSELDETGFSASFDPTWDTGYLDLLDRRSSACPSATTPTANHSSGLDISAYQTPGFASPVCQNPGLAASELECSPNPGSRVESSIAKQPISGHPANMTPPAVSLTNGGLVAVSRANVLLTPPTQMPTPSQNGLHGNPNPNPSPNSDPDHHLNANQGVLNRTARPFTPGPTSPRASVTSVMFRPPQPKPLTVASKPVAAVSMVTIQPSKHPSGPDTKRAVSSTSLYIPPRNSNGSAPPSIASPPLALSPSSSFPTAPFLQPATGLHPFSPQPAAPPPTPLSPSAPPTMFCSPAQPYAPPTPQQFPPPLAPASSPCVPASPISPQHHTNMPHTSLPVLPSAPPVPPSPHLSPSFHPYTNMTDALTSNPHNAVAAAPPPQPAAATAPAAGDLPVAREQRIAVPASRTGILQDARRRPNKKPMFAAVQKMDVSPNPDLMCMVQNMDGHTGRGPESGATAAGETGHESGPEEDWLRLGAEACNFMQVQRGMRPPPVAPKPQAPQVPQLAGKGGQLFARRQNRMDRYVVERSPSVAAAPYSPAQTREPSPTPSLPATWKYSSNVRAPPPISYNPLLSPSCPPKAQKKPEPAKSRPAGSKAQKKGKSVDVMNHQPYQLNSSLFSYGGGASQDSSTYQQHGMLSGPQKTARVCEVKRFSTPPPTSNGPGLKLIAPRSATTLGEPLWRSELTSPPPPADPAPFQPQWASSPLSAPPPPAPTAPLPQLPTFSSPPAPNPVHPPTVSHLLPSSSAQASKQFQSAPELSPVGPCGASRVTSSSAQPPRVPRPRFSTSSLGLQPSVWRPGSTMQ